MQVLVEAKKIAEKRLPPKVIFLRLLFYNAITCGGDELFS